MTLNIQTGNMYEWVTHTWNPIVGKCFHDCSYCYVKSNPFCGGKLRLSTSALRDSLGKKNTVFICSTADIFAEDVPDEWIDQVIAKIRKYPQNTYLIQSKNPKRFLGRKWDDNVIIGTTLETNKDTSNFSKAPSTYDRYQWLKKAEAKHKMVSIEPILDFDIPILLEWIRDIQPDFVSIGADSKNHNLQEPDPNKIKEFTEQLQTTTSIKIKTNLSRIENLKSQVCEKPTEGNTELETIMQQEQVDREQAYQIHQNRKEIQEVRQRLAENHQRKKNMTEILKQDRFATMTQETSKTLQTLDISIHVEEYFKVNENTGKPRLIIADLARDIIFTKEGINRGILLLDDNQKIHWYNGIYWQENGEEFLKDKIQRILGEHTCSRYIGEIINWIKNCRDIHITRDEFDSKTHLLGLKNGVFNLNTFELEEYSPDALISQILNVEYKKDVPAPVFNSFIDDVLYQDDKNVLQEMTGYILDKKNPLAKLFMLVGYGRNGKSTFLNTLIFMLGKHNISSVPLQAIANESFSRIDLYRKYANIVNDLSSKELKDTGLIKMLTGHDPIRARNLYEKSMLFYNTAKLISAMNEIPACDDKTTAWKERVAVIEFPNQFLDDNPKTDKDIFYKLTTNEEITGIFNWAIDGLKRIQKEKKFSKHKSLEDVAKFIKENKNPVYQFVIKCIKPSGGKVEGKDELYNKFLTFAVKNNFPTMGKSAFGENLKRYLTELGLVFGEGQSKILGRTWHDIEYHNPDENQEDKDNEEKPTYTQMDFASGVDQYEGMTRNEVQDDIDNI